MKKLLVLSLGIILLNSCTKQDILPEPQVVTPELKILSTSGIKLASSFVTDEVSMNVKLESAGVVNVKILDISNKIVSKETMNVNAGDNILKVYTKALPSSAYRIALYDINNVLIGVTDFNKL
jgi:hypothetical protein